MINDLYGGKVISSSELAEVSPRERGLRGGGKHELRTF